MNQMKLGTVSSAFMISAALFFATVIPQAYAEALQEKPMVVHRYSNDPMSGEAKAYEEELLALALQYTKEEYGPSTILPVKGYKLSQERALVNMSENRHPNFIRTFGYEARLTQELGLSLIPFPTRLGMFGYRICFNSQKAAQAFSQAKALKDLKPFEFSSGIGWIDEKILKHNGLNVSTIPTLEGMYKMADVGRIDAVCRGAPEIMPEFYGFKQLESLVYNKNLALYYPLPLFFYTHKSNKALIARMNKGLEMAYQKGDVQALWNRHHREGIKFVDIKSRYVIRLENPFLKGVDTQYERYIYSP